MDKYEDIFKSQREKQETYSPKEIQDLKDSATLLLPARSDDIPHNLEWPHRSLGAVLNDMERVLELNPVPVPLMHSLVLEAKIYEDRMSAKLEDSRHFKSMKKEYKELKEEVETLKKTKEELS